MVLLASMSALPATAQQTRDTGDFTGIKAGDSFNINISQSETNSVKVDAPENVLSQIKTEVKDGILVISSEGNLKTDKDITISVGIKTLSSLDVSGAADVKSENQLKTDKLKIESSGAGDINLDLKAGEVKGSVSGAGDLTLKGSAQLFEINVSGAGDLKASDLEAEKVKAKVSGAGSAKVNVKQSLDADVSGAGDIIYKGNPVDRNVNISGAGSVRESKSGTGEETASDTTKIKLGGRNYMIIGDDKDDKEEAHNSKDSIHDYNSDFKHWNGIELGANGLMDFKNSLNLSTTAPFMELDYAKSYQFGLNLFEKDFHIYKNYINLVTGLGFNFNHYSFANNITLHTDTTYIWASSDSVKYRRNKLNVSYVRAPLLLEFNTSKNPNKNFHIAVGAEFAYRIHAVTKQRFDLNDKHYRIKQRDDFNLEPFNTSLVARVGYNKVTVYASYGLNRLFKKDEGPQVYPVGLGICWTL
ncbi:MAG: hypothetical protein K0Q95_1694 [Bacteroidota bacterium]|nr:hypothetical protein [Bacteroidota bacterium]